MLKEAWHDFVDRWRHKPAQTIVAGLNLSTVTDKEIDLAVGFLSEQK